jgi:YVTN family beta-propeller protein
VIGFVPGQGDAAALGCVPGCAAQSARGIGFRFVPSDRELGHLTHTFSVVGGRVAILSKETNAPLADRWQIARHRKYKFHDCITQDFDSRENNNMRFVKLCTLCIGLGATAIAAETPSPALLVLNKADRALAIVDPASGKVIARVSVGEGPHEVAVSTDGRFAFVGNYGQQTPGNTISVIDLVEQKELRRVDLGALRRPHGMFFAGGKVYFTAETNRLIARYDPGANQIDWLFGTGQATTHMVIANPDASRFFTSNIGSDSISAIERVSGPAGWTETVIPVGKGPEGIDWSPDGKEVWSATGGDGGVSIIDVETKKVIQTLSVGSKRTNRLKFTPDGNLVLLSDSQGGELIVLDRATKKERARIPMGRSPEGIQMEPGGVRAYVAQEGANDVAIVDLKTLTIAGHISTGNGPDGMAWAVRK